VDVDGKNKGDFDVEAPKSKGDIDVDVDKVPKSKDVDSDAKSKVILMWMLMAKPPSQKEMLMAKSKDTLMWMLIVKLVHSCPQVWNQIWW